MARFTSHNIRIHALRGVEMDWGVPSDAESGRFSGGVYIKLSQCPSILQERFVKAREVMSVVPRYVVPAILIHVDSYNI